jgi:hypothetical protein
MTLDSRLVGSRRSNRRRATRRESRALLLFFVGPVVAYLVALLAIALFVVTPPTLGWIGFGVAAAIGLLVGAAASRLYPLTRTNAVRRHPRPADSSRLLVVADVHCDLAALCEAVERHVGDRPVEVFVVAPVLASPLHFLTDDEPGERRDAGTRLEEALQGLRNLGIAARGAVGSDDPLQAIGDALTVFRAGEIVLAAPETSGRRWLEHDLEQRIRDVYGVHVSMVGREERQLAAHAG